MLLVEKTYLVFLEQFKHVVDGVAVFLAVYGIEPVDGLHRLLQVLAIFLRSLVERLQESCERCHTHTEKLVEVV